MARLDGKVVIVTGAAQGTGGGIARRAAAEMGAIEHMPAAEMERVLRVNLLGTMFGTRAVIPARRAAARS